jgi:O-antigen ligase
LIEPAGLPAAPGARPGTMGSARAALVESTRHLAGEPAVPITAAAVAAATLVLVILGAAPGESLGSGYGRVLPFVVAILAPLLAGGAVIAPWRGLVAWIAIMPVLLLPRVQVTIGALQVTLTTAIVLALLAGLLLERRRQVLAHFPEVGRLSRHVWLAVAALSALSIASAVASGDLTGGLPIVLHGVIEPAVLLGVVVGLRPGSRQIGWLGLAMGVSVAAASVYSVLRISKVATSVVEVAAQRQQLAHFTYYNVGIYGDMLAMALPLLLVSILAWRELGLRRWSLALLLIGLVFSLIGLYETFSKSAWIGAVAAIGFVALVWARTWPRRGAVVLAGLVIAAFIVPYPLYLIRALGQSPSSTNPYVAAISGFQGGRIASWNPDSSEGEVSISERLLATEAALRMAADHPVLGIGPGRFGIDYLSTRYRPRTATRKLGSAHDFLPNLAAELGIPAAILVFLAFVIASAALVRAYLSGDRLRRLLAVGLGGSIIGFVIVGATFGIDLYRTYRVMNADVLFAGLLVAAGLCLGSRSANDGRSSDELDGGAEVVRGLPAEDLSRE